MLEATRQNDLCFNRALVFFPGSRQEDITTHQRRPADDWNEGKRVLSQGAATSKQASPIGKLPSKEPVQLCVVVEHNHLALVETFLLELFIKLITAIDCKACTSPPISEEDKVSIDGCDCKIIQSVEKLPRK